MISRRYANSVPLPSKSLAIHVVPGRCHITSGWMVVASQGDPTALKHAGLAPGEKLSGNFTGRTKLTGQGRSGLRLAAWRAVWRAQRANLVYQARYRYLTTRETNKLTATQAQTVIAAAILRQFHAGITTGRAWDPDIATHGTRRVEVPLAA